MWPSGSRGHMEVNLSKGKAMKAKNAVLSPGLVQKGDTSILTIP